MRKMSKVCENYICTWVEVGYLRISGGGNFPVLSLKFLFSFSLMKLNCGMNQREGKERVEIGAGL